jgi:hypothetical protein
MISDRAILQNPIAGDKISRVSTIAKVLSIRQNEAIVVPVIFDTAHHILRF